MSAAQPARRRVYLMRHGSVDYFTPEGKPLAADQVPLNAKGVAQARAAGRLFAEQGVKFDRIVHSGLPRTIETARLVAELSGHSGIPEARERLQEIRGGRLASIAERDLLAAFTAVADGVVDDDARFLGGETVGGFLARVLPEVDALRADTTWDTALWVLHGAVNRAILSYFVTGSRRLLGAFEQSPACINVIDLGTRPLDVVLRVVNLSPLDWLQPHDRRSTMEHLFEQYSHYRRHLESAPHV
jgi:probable phosphoglycerate mutase